MLRFLPFFILAISLNLTAKPNKEDLLSQYKLYPFDGKTIRPHKAEWDKYRANYVALKGTTNQLTIEQRKENIKIIEGIHTKEPQWIDGYWILSSEMFQLASSYTDEKDHPLARTILADGRDKAKECLKIQKDNPLCKFFLASSLGKIGTIDGVFASLKGAKQVHDLWMEAKDSPYNHFFTDKISMQGSVRYAFGIFFRLVPDWSILKWIFGVKGDLDDSIKYLEEAIAMDGPFPCSRLMLAASLLCRADGDESSEDFKKAFSLIDRIQSMPNQSVQSAVCKVDGLKMKKKPSNGCGYSTAKQQEKPDETKL